MSLFFILCGFGLGFAGLVALLTGAWLAAIALGLFAWGSLSLGVACD